MSGFSVRSFLLIFPFDELYQLVFPHVWTAGLNQLDAGCIGGAPGPGWV